MHDFYWEISRYAVIVIIGKLPSLLRLLASTWISLFTTYFFLGTRRRFRVGDVEFWLLRTMCVYVKGNLLKFNLIGLKVIGRPSHPDFIANQVKFTMVISLIIIWLIQFDFTSSYLVAMFIRFYGYGFLIKALYKKWNIALCQTERLFCLQ